MRERRMGKYIVSIVLALAMVIGLAVFTLPTTASAATWDGTMASGFAGGDGTEGNPYQIATPEQWAYFANRNNTNTGASRIIGEYYVLTADIVFNTGDASTWETSAPANDTEACMVGPVWDYNKGANCFAGYFDGQGHIISGFYVNRTGDNGKEGAGIFCSTGGDNTSVIKNLVVTNSYLAADGSIGTITGQTSGTGSSFDSILVTESVYIRAYANHAGGIVGNIGGNNFPNASSKSATISNCACGATITSNNENVAAILGSGNGSNTTVSNCLNFGTITGYNYVAGIVGRNGYAANVNNCASITTTTATKSGGYNYRIASSSASGSKIKVNYCVAETTSWGRYSTNTGSVADENITTNFVSGSFLSSGAGLVLNRSNTWSELVGQTFNWGKVHLTVNSGLCLPTALFNAIKGNANMRDIFEGSSFFTCTVVVDGATPSWLLTAWNNGTINIDTTDKYIQFVKFFNGGYYNEECTGGMSGKTLNLTANLTFNTGDASTWGDTAPANDMTEFIIGSTTNPFKGTFNGNGYTISGFYAKKTDSDTVAIFGSTAAGSTANLHDLVITNSYFEGPGSVAALVGQTSGGSTQVSNIYVTDSVYIVSSDSYAAGIIGHTGGNGFDFISGTPAVIIDSCVNAATITATSSSVGGILGNANNKQVTVTNCLNMGDITGTKNVGGIIGFAAGGTNIAEVVNYCVNTGKITATTTPSNAYEKACAITGFTSKSSKSATGCYYLAGTATYGVVKGTSELSGAATAVAGADMFTTLLADDIPSGLEGGSWVARGNGSNIFEICIPSAFEPYTLPQSEHYLQSNAPTWLRCHNYVSTFDIGTVAQYKEFANFINGGYTHTLARDFDGKTVRLTADLNFNNEDITNYIVASTAANPFRGTFDGQGHTISGVVMSKEAGEGDTVGLFGFTAGGKVATFKNLLVTNSTFESGDGAVGAIVAQTAGGVTNILNIYIDETVTVTSGNAYAGGIIGHNGGNGYGNPKIVADSCVNAANVTATGANDCTNFGGIIGNGNGNSVEISNCLNLGEITGYRYVGGILGRGKANEGVVVTVTGCINVGQVTSTFVTLTNEGAACAIADFGSTARTSITSANCYYLRGTGLRGTYESNSYIDENTTAVSLMVVANATLPEGLDSEKWTARGVEGEPMTLELCIPTGVASFAPSTTSFNTIYDVPTWLRNYADTSSFTITSVTQWQQIANYVNGNYVENGDFEGKTVLLGANLTFTGNSTVYMIGSMTHPFAGTFNGQGYTISGFRAVKTDADEVGLFGSTSGGKVTTIQNLVITNSHFEAAGGAVGALIGQTSGGKTIVENVYVTATVEIVSNGDFVGGLVGHVGQNGYSFITGEPALSVNGCVNAADIETDYNNVGGILGNGNNKVIVISNCLNVGSISGGRTVGGIAGNLSMTATVSNCVNAGPVAATASDNLAYHADIATGNVSAGREVTISNCYYIYSPFYSASDKGTVNLSGNVAYVEIEGKNLGWSGWSQVSGGIPVPTVLASKVGTLKLYFNFKTLNGASVRLGEPSGIRFKAQFSKSYIDGLGANLDRIGVVIAPKVYVDEAGEFTIEALDAYQATLGGKRAYVAIDNSGAGFVYANASTASADGYYTFNGVLANIKAANYEVEFCAIAFVELKNGEVLYSEYNESRNIRTIADVAEKAYNDVVLLDENAGVTGYMNYVETIEGDETKYKYSPYTAAQRDVLYNFFKED